MKIFDEYNNIVENPDLTKGELLPDFLYTICKFEGAEESGEGEWVAYQGENIVELPLEIPENALKQNDILFAEEIIRYHIWTEEELDEKEKGTVKERMAQVEADVSFIAMMTDVELEG